ncbi:hypothetical protein [Nocardia sp. XZ_19_369]|uniref:hypothetical protein n=1 Tax=Nocardia sp. XZ_19_369 TaxID=2769487 RepID=UPI00188E4759|nr:hypothetical protein [Nocardia sp. XZ_19_369]
MGMEVVVGMIVAWLIGKGNRAAGRLDSRTDQVVDAAADRLWEIVSRKLGMTAAIRQLADDASAGSVPENTRRDAQQTLEDAAMNDPGFAAEINALLGQVPSHTSAGAVTNTGPVQGGIVAGQIYGWP